MQLEKMKKKTTSEEVQCEHFRWKLRLKLNGIYQADGRGNSPPLGQHSLGTRNYQEARQTLTRLDKVMARRLNPAAFEGQQSADRPPLSLAEGIADYLAYCRRPRSAKGCGKSTIKRYTAIFANASRFFSGLGITNWSQIRKREIEKYGAHLEQAGKKQATQVMEMVTVKQLINFFMESQRLPDTSRFRLDIDKVDETTTYCYTDKEVAAMIAHCQSQEELLYLADVLVTLANTGMRIGELVQLRWSAVDFRQKMIRILDESRTNGGANVRTTKGRENRSVPIRPPLMEVLQRRYQQRQTGVVFTALRGGPLHERNVLSEFIEQVIEPLRDRLHHPVDDEKGFADGRLHSFRHYFCSLCANGGISDQTVMRWLGHKSSEVTRRYYHLTDEESHRQMEKLGDS